MERGEDVLLEEVFSIYIRRHVVERSAHRTFAVWDGTEIEQSVDDRCSLLIHFDAVVEFADELSSWPTLARKSTSPISRSIMLAEVVV